MLDNLPYRIRFLDLNDIEEVVALSDSEGWNQTEKDWRLLIGNPVNTCIAADHNGEIIGTATALNHSGKVAWIGMVIVKKSFRGQGIGKSLLTHIIGELKSFESIKLDARPDGVSLYHKLGFSDEYEISRIATISLRGNEFKIPGEIPVPIDNENIARVLKFDNKVFGADRSYLIRTLYSVFPGKAYCLFSSGKLDGYMFGREGKRYNYIGPLSADSSETARILLSEVLGSMADQPVAIDILSSREDIIKWLETLGFEKQCSYVRMYLKSNCYRGNTKYQYLISGPEFG